MMKETAPNTMKDFFVKFLLAIVLVSTSINGIAVAQPSFLNSFRQSLSELEDMQQKEKRKKAIIFGACCGGIAIIVIVIAYSLLDENKKSNEKTNEFSAYLSAALNGVPDAQYKVGKCYANGDGVDKNISEAKAWYKKAADQGHTEAQKNLAALGY